MDELKEQVKEMLKQRGYKATVYNKVEVHTYETQKQKMASFGHTTHRELMWVNVDTYEVRLPELDYVYSSDVKSNHLLALSIHLKAIGKWDKYDGVRKTRR